MKRDLLIVGAGPTGLTAAVELARRGVIPRVIDKKSEASTLSRAVGINARTLNLLARAKVTEELISNGIKLKEARVYLKEKVAFKIGLGLAPKPHDFLLALPQDVTEKILTKRFESFGGLVEYGVELKSLKNQQNVVDVVLKSIQTGESEEETFSKVLGADGVKSVVRSKAGIEFVGTELPEDWSVVDFDSKSWPNRDAFCFYAYEGGRVCVVVPIGENRYRGVTDRPDAPRGLPSDLQIDNIRRKGNFSIWIKQADKYQKGNVFIAGDAAHCHSPVGGRGMNLGIIDAVCFAELYSEGKLDEYTKRRHDHGRRTVRLTEIARKILTNEWPGKTLILKYIVPALLRVLPIQRIFVRNAVDYPGPDQG